MYFSVSNCLDLGYKGAKDKIEAKLFLHQYMCIDMCIYNYTNFLFQATDPDEGLNGQVVYEIVDSTLSTPFGLNSSTGVLFTFLEFFRTSNNVNLNPYQLTVRASDRATVVDQQRTDTTVFVSLVSTEIVDLLVTH